MKYIICCDFATLKCSRLEFANKLSEISTNFLNLNNYTWEFELEEYSFLPFNSDNMCESIYVIFSEFLTKDSFFMVFKITESFSHDDSRQLPDAPFL